MVLESSSSPFITKTAPRTAAASLKTSSQCCDVLLSKRLCAQRSWNTKERAETQIVISGAARITLETTLYICSSPDFYCFYFFIIIFFFFAEPGV